jgi:membrane protein YdbS with pleckstrin-like domain
LRGYVDRVAYPQRLLNPGETVVVDVRPHWWYLSGPAVLEILIIAGAIAAAAASVPTWVVWVALVALVASTVWLVFRYVRWSTTRLVVTSTRVIERKGVLARQGREIPLSALSDIGYRQSIFGQIIGLGDVLLESAGKNSQEVFPDLPHPGEIHNQIYQQLEARRGPAPPVGATGPSISERIEQLDQLRRKGLITDQEYEAKKSELLDRL